MYEFHLPTLEDMRDPRNGGMQMLNMINKDGFRSALITGVAGSGKTTISIQRLKRLKNQGKQVIFLTLQRLLAGTVSISDAAETATISTFHNWQYQLTGQLFGPPSDDVFDQRITIALNNKNLIEGMHTTELIIDEGQDLPEVVYRVLPRFFERCLVGADNGQKVHKNGASAESIAVVLSERYQVFTEQELGQNFRNTFEVFRFARQFLPHTNLNAWNDNILERLEKYNRRGELPQLVYYSNVAERDVDLVKAVGNAFRRGSSIAVLSIEKREAVYIYNIVKQHHAATLIHSDVKPLPPLEGCLITTFLSAKGLEFDEVIITQINNNDLNDWTIRQQCYVACTRAKNRLLIYSDTTKTALDPKHFLPDTYESRQLMTVDNSGEVPF